MPYNLCFDLIFTVSLRFKRQSCTYKDKNEDYKKLLYLCYFYRISKNVGKNQGTGIKFFEASQIRLDKQMSEQN